TTWLEESHRGHRGHRPVVADEVGGELCPRLYLPRPHLRPRRGHLRSFRRPRHRWTLHRSPPLLIPGQLLRQQEGSTQIPLMVLSRSPQPRHQQRLPSRGTSRR
ncbi:hypothetical protein PIB30_112739, partial [Stylosanthes scabra]|nr:hypothetical protein [Stylosanthes scabra]